MPLLNSPSSNLNTRWGYGGNTLRTPELNTSIYQYLKKCDEPHCPKAVVLNQAKFLTYYFLSVILFLRVEEESLVITFLMCVV